MTPRIVKKDIDTTEIELLQDLAKSFNSNKINFKTSGSIVPIITQSSDGTINIQFETVPKITVATTAPTNPNEGDIWVDSSS